MMNEPEDGLGTNLPIGSLHYRAFVGPPDKYDLIAAAQFNLLTALGLREYHFFLDIGCGSLRGGRLFIPYLLPGRYFGIEPEQWLIDQGVQAQLGGDIIRIKRPSFSNDAYFNLSVFGRTFDFILAQSIFSHASFSQIETCLSEASKIMTATSIFATTFFEGDQSYTGGTWVYPGSVTYRLDDMVHLAEKYGLVFERTNWPHPSHQTWAVMMQQGEKTLLSEVLQRADLFHTW